MTKSAHHHDVEGWDLFEFGLNTGLMEIQIDSDVQPPVFETDAIALAYVERKAAEGSVPHQEALKAHGFHPPVLFETDADALAYVERKAAEGSVPHQEALEAHRRDAPAIAKLREGHQLRERQRD